MLSNGKNVTHLLPAMIQIVVVLVIDLYYVENSCDNAINVEFSCPEQQQDFNQSIKNSFFDQQKLGNNIEMKSEKVIYSVNFKQIEMPNTTKSQ